MKLACVDTTARARLELQRSVEAAFDACRDSVGHAALAFSYPASREELFLNSPPDFIVVGAEYSAEDAYLLCSQVRRA
ncbi:MAG: hypothetical protein KDD44_09390, partial [Bdellovibrionales bacterium]|nr:hypothetical protein [Bdellovibrionales bacterium]